MESSALVPLSMSFVCGSGEGNKNIGENENISLVFDEVFKARRVGCRIGFFFCS